MATCICSAVRLLAEQYDENRARELIPSLNSHLKDLRTVLAQSKSLTREVQYRITSTNDRTSRAFFVYKVDLEPVYELYRRFGDNLEGVWTAPDNHVHPDLRRRLACVVVFLRSKLDSHMVPPQIARVFPGQKNFTDIRNSGRKYIKIARKLGGLGSILWLPLDIPPSTYERYLNIDDEEVFTHLKSLCPEAQVYTHAVQRLILSQFNDGDIAKSEAHIRDFEWRGSKPASRRDHALQGRLHISQIENKIKCFDNDLPSFIYRWEAEQPLSTLDIEVTFRLQSTAARYFQSIGDFSAARASLEQFLSLNTTKPIRSNSRRILIGRLADIYCEMHEFSKADEILQPELDAIHESDRSRRGFRRILLASVEASMGLGRLEASESVLRELEDATPFELDNVHDQQLHMRRLFAAARMSHMRSDHEQTLLRWRFALQEVERMHTLQSTSGFTAAVIHLSLAHIQLIAGDRDSSRSSWATGSDILKREKCDFWIPVVSTTWLREVATEVHRLQGWSLRMMLPGGRPEITWP
ncbi:hypothetical protein FDECE_4455 [Fusarium decemcellulare]|nr:hypothetical protein FDECE_4455 [Fusarium decemcellulare]